MLKKIAADSSLLVGLINPRDLWRNQAIALHQALDAAEMELIYCVVTEAISAAVRRLHEKKRFSEVEALFNRLNLHVPPETITWILPDVSRLYPEVIRLMLSSGGALNFNDALIALACRERGIPAIASFDTENNN
jgi:predicted nucleic acid-binding protein